MLSITAPAFQSTARRRPHNHLRHPRDPGATSSAATSICSPPTARSRYSVRLRFPHLHPRPNQSVYRKPSTSFTKMLTPHGGAPSPPPIAPVFPRWLERTNTSPSPKPTTTTSAPTSPTRASIPASRRVQLAANSPCSTTAGVGPHP